MYWKCRFVVFVMGFCYRWLVIVCWVGLGNIVCVFNGGDEGVGDVEVCLLVNFDYVGWVGDVDFG